MDPRLITHEGAAARELIEQRLRQVMKGRIKLRSGPGMDNLTESEKERGLVIPSDKSICIMEATAFILGYPEVSDDPPCTSGVIKQEMIGLNDCEDTTDRKRAMLKVVIPEIVNTAPTRWRQVNRSKKQPVFKLVTHQQNPEYKLVEKRRKELLAERIEELRPKGSRKITPTWWGDSGPYDQPILPKEDCTDLSCLVAHVPFARLLDVIRELAALGKFSGSAPRPETEVAA